MGRKTARNMRSHNTNKTGIQCICWFYSQGIPYLSSAHSVLSNSATVYSWQCVVIYVTSLSHSMQLKTTVYQYIILHIYPSNKYNYLLDTGKQWQNINQLSSLDNIGNSNTLTDFITRSCSVWYIHSQYTNANIITATYTIFFLLYTLIFIIFPGFYLSRIPSFYPHESHNSIHSISIRGHHTCSFFNYNILLVYISTHADFLCYKFQVLHTQVCIYIFLFNIHHY